MILYWVKVGVAGW